MKSSIDIPVLQAQARRLMRTKEASEYTGIGEWRLKQLVAQRRLPVVRFEESGPFLIDRKDLDDLIERTKSQIQNATTELSNEPAALEA